MVSLWVLFQMTMGFNHENCIRRRWLSSHIMLQKYISILQNQHSDWKTKGKTLIWYYYNDEQARQFVWLNCSGPVRYCIINIIFLYYYKYNLVSFDHWITDSFIIFVLRHFQELFSVNQYLCFSKTGSESWDNKIASDIYDDLDWIQIRSVFSYFIFNHASLFCVIFESMKLASYISRD